MLPMLSSTADASLLLPTGFDVAWWLIAAVVVLLVLGAFVRLARSSELTVTARVVWVALILLTPPLGPVAALLIVRSGRPVGQP